MTPPPNPLEWSARLVVDLVRALANRRILVSGVALALTLAAAFAYVAIDGLGVNPARTTISVRVLLPESGGLLANQDVTLRGIPVGRVKSVNLTDKGVEAVAVINADVGIPRDSPVRVSALSGAGSNTWTSAQSTGAGRFWPTAR